MRSCEEGEETTMNQTCSICSGVLLPTNDKLIAALDVECAGALFAAIVVITARLSIAVPSDKPDRLERLNYWRKNGGAPLGMMVLERVGRQVKLWTYPYPEYGGQEKVESWLHDAAVVIGREVLASWGIKNAFQGATQMTSHDEQL
jgi:hypothetical protein